MSNPKAEFFRNSLVPAGQLMLLVQAVMKQTRQAPRDSLPTIPRDGWEALNLASWYVLQSGPLDLIPLETAVNNLAGAMITVLQESLPPLAPQGRTFPGITQPTRLTAIAQIMSTGFWHNGLTKMEEQTRARSALLCFRDQLPQLCRHILEAVGYQAPKRMAWIAEHRNKALPFGRTGAIGHWKTLVRNGDWGMTLHRLGHADPFSVACYSNGFSSPQGRSRINTLWTEVFTAAYAQPPLVADAVAPKVAAVAAKAVSAANAAVAELTRVPQGITVSVTRDGLLQVQASLDPISQLPPERARKVTEAQVKGTLPAQVLSHLRPTSFSLTCEVPDLADALARAQGFLNTGLPAREYTLLQAEVRAWEIEQETGELIAAFTKQFNPKQRRTLIDLIKAGKLTA